MLILQYKTGVTYSSSVLADNPVGYWRVGEPLSEKDGGSAVDSSVNGNNGTYQNIVNLGVTGAIAGDSDTCARLQRSSGDYISIPDSTDFNMGGGNITIELWAQFADITLAPDKFYPLVAKRNNPTPLDWQLAYLVASNATPNILRFNWGGASIQTAESTGTITDTNWHHIALTFDGTTVNFYIDGSSAGSVGNTTALTDSASTISIGYDNVTPAVSYVDAFVDEIAIYDSIVPSSSFTTRHGMGS